MVVRLCDVINLAEWLNASENKLAKRMMCNRHDIVCITASSSPYE